VASVSPSSLPLLASLWFLLEHERFWFSSARSSALSRAAARGGQVAVIVDDFNPPGSIRQVRVRGTSRLDQHDSQKVRRIYQRYLGTDFDRWPSFFQERVNLTDEWTLWSVSPESGIAVTYPDFIGAEFRWTSPGEAPFGKP
jgi:Pyridoxamine 5'-phosphate oxidase